MDDTSKRKNAEFSSRHVQYDELDPYRELRARLQLTQPDLKVISMLSSDRTELKSQAAIYLAETYAAAGKKTVLVDADLREPVLSARVAGASRASLNGLLQGSHRLEDALIQINTYGALFFLPAEPAPENSTELLESAALPGVIDELRSRFDYVIIDNLPFKEGMDAYAVSRHCDGAVFSVNEGVTGAAGLIDRKKILDEAGIPVLGAVYQRS